MSDSSEPPAPPSPYGPAEPVGAHTAPAAAGDPPWVERGRRILRIAIIVTAGLSVLATLALIVLGALGMGTADNDLIGIGAAITWTMVLGAPVLFVIAINLLVWRALLRPFARRSRGEAITIGIVVGLGLALLSVVLVVIVLTIGFFVGATTGI